MPERLCSSCGVPLSAGATSPICPRCALVLALDPKFELPESLAKPGSEDVDSDHSDPSTSSSIESLCSTVRYFGDYELLEEIARGGMGVVFKARQMTLNRLIAVKMLLPGLVGSVERVRRFRTEAEAAASLSHPNIVAIHEIGEHRGQHYFSMDYVEGEDLAEHLQHSTLSSQQTAAFLIKIAEAIHHAHQRGILHRDLKPANILVGPGDEPFVTDFGIAKLLHDRRDLTQSGQVLGTPSFMSPEQADPKRGEVTTSSDIYSLGALCYYMLTGQSPFRNTTVEQTLLAVLE